MNVRYESLSDVLVVRLRRGAAIAEIREDGRGSRFSFDEKGRLVALEIVDASRRRDLMRSFEGRLEVFLDAGGSSRKVEDVGDEGGSNA